MIRVFGMIVALHSWPFYLFMWYNKPVSSYPYESLSWNLILGSSINLTILMQCVSDCCKDFVSVNSTSHNGQQSFPTSTWVSFMETSSSFCGLLFLFLAAKGSWINSQLPCSYEQVYAPPEYFCLKALGTICPV